MAMSLEQPSQGNPWFAVSIGLMGLILGFSIASFTGSSFGFRLPAVPAAPSVPSVPTPPSDQPPESPVPEVTKDDHYRGPADAKAVIVEYLDFECPFCHRNAETMRTVMQSYSSNVAHVVRHFPLEFHPMAMPYARASECVASLAGENGFWKFYDAVFDPTNTAEMSEAQLPIIAKNIGVNGAKFDECYKAKAVDAKIQAQQKAGSSAGINGTPGIAIVNVATKTQTRLPGAVPFTDYQAALDPIVK